MHVLKRGGTYNYVRRIPTDLARFFPCTVMHRSLKTKDEKEARLLAASYNYETEKAFMRLRTGMLETFEAQILVERLTRKIQGLDAVAYGQKRKPILEAIEQHNIKQHMGVHGCSEREARKMIAQGYSDFAEVLGESLADNDVSMNMREVGDMDRILRKEYKVMLNHDEKRQLAMKFLNMDKECLQVESEIRRGNHDHLDRLKERQERISKDAGKRYFLHDIMKAYIAEYDTAEKSGIQLNSWRAVKRHTSFITKVLGNIEFTELNTKATTDKLKHALDSKVSQRGKPFSTKEHSSYMARLKSLVSFAIDKYDIDVVNKIKVIRKASNSKDSFSYEDIKRLEDALCNAPMVFSVKQVPRTDRFWILLIALLHGFRKTSIVNLRGRHIRVDKQTKLTCFDLTGDAAELRTKTDNMRSLVPLHPLLLELGFTKWLDKQPMGDTRLFADTPDSFGVWFNGIDRTSGWNYDYITKDDNKTFHSLRHYFCCCMDELNISEKQKNEMSGHAGNYKGQGTRQQHYLERTRVKTMMDTFLKSVEPERILKQDLDWERLKARAVELFDM